MEVEEARRHAALQIGGEQNAVLRQLFGKVADHQHVGRDARHGDVLHVDVRVARDAEVLLALNEHRNFEILLHVLTQRRTDIDVVLRDDDLRARLRLRAPHDRALHEIAHVIRVCGIAGEAHLDVIRNHAGVVRDAHAGCGAHAARIGDGDYRRSRRFAVNRNRLVLLIRGDGEHVRILHRRGELTERAVDARGLRRTDRHLQRAGIDGDRWRRRRRSRRR